MIKLEGILVHIAHCYNYHWFREICNCVCPPSGTNTITDFVKSAEAFVLWAGQTHSLISWKLRMCLSSERGKHNHWFCKNSECSICPPSGANTITDFLKSANVFVLWAGQIQLLILWVSTKNHAHLILSYFLFFKAQMYKWACTVKNQQVFFRNILQQYPISILQNYQRTKLYWKNNYWFSNVPSLPWVEKECK